jgi:pyridoxal 5'-phosphate synthase pdxT subunit
LSDFSLGNMKRVGVLALQGGVEEHVNALLRASEKLGVPTQIVEVRTAAEAEGLDGIVIPGGESTVISKLMSRAGLFESVLKIRKIMGTCAGAIMMAKQVEGALESQRFLSLMDIRVSRNAYGSQLSSFETPLIPPFGRINGVFIRAPRFFITSKEVQPLAFLGEEPVAVYQQNGEHHYLALTFHPELTSTKFHEFFLKL